MKKSTFIISAIILLALIAGIYLYSNSSSESSTGNVINSQDGKTHTINIKASRFQFDPGTITVKKGEHVKLVIDNVDTTHGIVIPTLGVSGIDSVEFDATTPGTYEFKCPTMCGSGHRDMKGTLIIE